MTWVKICGTTNLEDALVAVDAGADAVGFVFYEKSPRYVSVETAREIVAKLPESLEKVGVFVNSPDWVDVVLATKLTAVQQYVFFGADSGNARTKATGMGVFPKPIKCFVARPIGHILETGAQISWRPSNSNRPPELAGILDTIFLDSGGPGSPGGTGKSFDWRKAAPLAEEMQRDGIKVVVAGGLTAENVREAMEILKPWGVDVASGVEASPGKKDPEKVRAFVKAVREFDRKAS